jgi:hypothetical protein
VAGEIAPPLERLDRKRRGAGHHQSEAARALRSRPLHVGRRGLPRCDQPVVDRRHRREDGDVARGKTIPDHLRVEGRQDLARRANRERRTQAVDDAVHMMQRQRQEQMIGRAPAPGLDQRRDLGADVLMRGDCAFWPPGRAARVDDHRAAVGAKVRQIVARGAGERGAGGHEACAGGPRQRRQHGRERRIAHDH